MTNVLIAPSVRESFARHYKMLSDFHPHDPEGVWLLATGWAIGHAIWAAEKLEHPFIKHWIDQLALESAPVSIGTALMLEAWNRKVRLWADRMQVTI